MLKVRILGYFSAYKLKIYFLNQENFKPLKKFNSIKKSCAKGISFLLFLLPESFERTP